MKRYMIDAWNIDMDQLRAVVNRRTKEVRHPEFKLLEDNWMPLLDNSDFRAVPARGSVEDERERRVVLEWIMSSPKMLEDRAHGYLGAYGCSLMTQHFSHPHND